MFHIVLVEPEIPGNTGNIARLCAGTGCALHLVKPLGFSIADRDLKRAGLDYWHLLDVTVYESYAEFDQAHAGRRRFYATTKGGQRLTDMAFSPGDMLVFGKETAGLPAAVLDAHADSVFRIPLRAEARSLNLSNAVAVSVYEALRQQGFPEMV